MNQDLDFHLTELDFLKTEYKLHDHLLNGELLQAQCVEYSHESLLLDSGSLTLAETEMAIKIGLMQPGKPMSEYLAAINHFQAVQTLRKLAEEQAVLSEALIKEFHTILSRGIDRSEAGVYRIRPLIGADGLAYPPPEDLPELMAEHIQWLRVEGAFMHPVKYAAECLRRLLLLRPFAEASGACARLTMNLILLEAGFPIANFPGRDAGLRLLFNSAEPKLKPPEQEAWCRLLAAQLQSDMNALLLQFSEAEGQL